MPSAQEIIAVERAQAPFFFGVDVGGTNIKIGLVDDHGQTLAFDEIATNEPAGPQQAVDRIGKACAQMAEQAGKAGLARQQIQWVGLGTPGTMDIPRGIFLEPPNLPHWNHFPIRDAVSTACGLPVAFINDANAASLGEFWVGTGAKVDSLILLTLGTGVGGGIIVDGHLVNGVNSFGSECGHIIVDSRPDARLCVWGGGRGQLEAYASASALAQRAEEALHRGAVTSLTRLAMAGKAITAKRIYEAAEIGDEFSLTLVDETAFYLGVAITTLVHTIDPGLVVLGGAMDFGGIKSPVGRRFLDKIRSVFAERTFPNVLAGTTIDFASLGGDAGYIGAAGFARKQFMLKRNGGNLA
jgi:glucokinase